MFYAYHQGYVLLRIARNSQPHHLGVRYMFVRTCVCHFLNLVHFIVPMLILGLHVFFYKQAILKFTLQVYNYNMIE